MWFTAGHFLNHRVTPRVAGRDGYDLAPPAFFSAFGVEEYLPFAEAAPDVRD